MKKFLVLAICFVVATATYAQNLMPRVSGFSTKKVSYITMKNGKKLEGRAVGVKLKKGTIKQLNFKPEDGSKKMKIKATDLKTFKAPASGLGKFFDGMEAATDINKQDKVEDSQRDYAFYEQAVLPNKKKTVVLLQLLNPSFSSKIKVYDDPLASESASAGVGPMTVAGGRLKSYYVKKGKKTIKVKKGSYKKQFKTLFGDCPSMMKMLEAGDIKWKDLGKHVYMYDQECGK